MEENSGVKVPIHQLKCTQVKVHSFWTTQKSTITAKNYWITVTWVFFIFYFTPLPKCSGSSQNPWSSVLDELQLSNGLRWKAGEVTITIIHPAGDKGPNKFLQISTGNKTSNLCKVFEMLVCWFIYCFDMATKTKVCIQNHSKIFY